MSANQRRFGAPALSVDEISGAISLRIDDGRALGLASHDALAS